MCSYKRYCRCRHMFHRIHRLSFILLDCQDLLVHCVIFLYNVHYCTVHIKSPFNRLKLPWYKDNLLQDWNYVLSICLILFCCYLDICYSLHCSVNRRFQWQQHKQTLLRMHAFVVLTYLLVDFQRESITTAK